MQQIRKAFDCENYQFDQTAFSYLQRDFKRYKNSEGGHYFPVRREEDYDVDVAVYESEQSYREGKSPIFFIELEIKSSACQWEKENYPYSDIHFLYRKAHLLYQPAVIFWVCYNYSGTDCVVVNLESILGFPIAENSSQVGDLVYILPVCLCEFGTDKIVDHIEQYVKEQTGVSDSMFKNNMIFYYRLMNRAYKSRHKYEQAKAAHAELLSLQRKNKRMVGIRTFV